MLIKLFFYPETQLALCVFVLMLNLYFECAYHGTITRFSTFFNCLRGTLILKRSAPEVLLQLTLMQLTSHRLATHGMKNTRQQHRRWSLEERGVIMSGARKKVAQPKQNWSEDETYFLIDLLKEARISEHLDGRKARTTEILQMVAHKFNEAGIRRTYDQIKNRWKVLKTAYFKAKAHNSVSGADPATSPYYDAMDDMMGHHPLANVGVHGVDVGFEDTSVAPTPEDDSIAGRSKPNITSCITHNGIVVFQNKR